MTSESPGIHVIGLRNACGNLNQKMNRFNLKNYFVNVDLKFDATISMLAFYYAIIVKV